MKILILLFLLVSSLNATAKVVGIPHGWVEMATPDPIILSWAKVIAGKKLEDSPTVMIQKHEHSKKWKSALEKLPTDSDGCKEVKAQSASDWNQLYCEKDQSIYAFLWRGDEKETIPALEAARKWLKVNE